VGGRREARELALTARCGTFCEPIVTHHRCSVSEASARGYGHRTSVRKADSIRMQMCVKPSVVKGLEAATLVRHGSRQSGREGKGASGMGRGEPSVAGGTPAAVTAPEARGSRALLPLRGSIRAATRLGPRVHTFVPPLWTSLTLARGRARAW